MSMANHKYYLTTPWHSRAADCDIDGLYTEILGDTIARQGRMAGFDVAHFAAPNAKIEVRNEAHTRAAESQPFGDLRRLLDIHPTHSADLTSPDHVRAVQTLLRSIMRYSPHAIYQAPYKGFYCPDDHIDIGESAKDAACPICGHRGKWISESRYFFRASAFQGELRALYKYRSEFVQPSGQSLQMERFIEHGLRDLAISGSFAVGDVPWPDAAGCRVSALLSELSAYLSGLGFAREGHGSDDFRRYWPANLHVVAKKHWWIMPSIGRHSS
jgi:methionyl-tRNA synthetase